jgi:riboflavin kinase/FMN adenylyltransferase
MNRAMVATIGVFDGFHLGHAAVVARASERARQCGAPLVVLTFDAHPRAVLARTAGFPQLTLLGEKIALLRQAGAAEVRVLNFSDRLAARPPRRFLEEHVYAFGCLAALVVGYDFAMGRERAGTIPVLHALGHECGFDVEGVPSVLDGDAPISSTRIRRLLNEGAVARAAGLLGRPYRLAGLVGAGDGRGRGLGFPTANLAVSPHKLQPARGVYAVRVRGTAFASAPGVVNLGARPTFGEGPPTVEVHILDFEGDLRGERLELEFVERLRPERKFAGAGELSAQIGRDAAAARERLSRPPDGR